MFCIVFVQVCADIDINYDQKDVIGFHWVWDYANGPISTQFIEQKVAISYTNVFNGLSQNVLWR